jgi:hypothetical protein
MELKHLSVDSLVGLIRNTSHYIDRNSHISEGQREKVCNTLAEVNLCLRVSRVPVSTLIDGVTKEGHSPWHKTFLCLRDRYTYEDSTILTILTILKTEWDRVERYRLYLELGRIYGFRHQHRNATDLLTLGRDLVCNILCRLEKGADRKSLAGTNRALREYELSSRPRLTLSNSANIALRALRALGHRGSSRFGSVPDQSYLEYRSSENVCTNPGRLARQNHRFLKCGAPQSDALMHDHRSSSPRSKKSSSTMVSMA